MEAGFKAPKLDKNSPVHKLPVIQQVRSCFCLFSEGLPSPVCEHCSAVPSHTTLLIAFEKERRVSPASSRRICPRVFSRSLRHTFADPHTRARVPTTHHPQARGACGGRHVLNHGKPANDPHAEGACCCAVHFGHVCVPYKCSSVDRHQSFTPKPNSLSILVSRYVRTPTPCSTLYGRSTARRPAP